MKLFRTVHLLLLPVRNQRESKKANYHKCITYLVEKQKISS